MSQSREDSGRPAPAAEETPAVPAASALDRRQFLGGMGLAVGAVVGGGGLAGLAAGEGTAEAAVEAPEDPIQRRNSAYQIRHQAALDAKAFGIPHHPTNGDEELYPTKIGNHTRTLPHNALGEVDVDIYNQLVAAIANNDLAATELIPKGGRLGYVNPLGGLAFNVYGSDSEAITMPPPPAIASREWAAQMAELYWMALLRDIPFTEYDGHPLVAQACADLSAFPGYTGPRDPVTGQVTPQILFRLAYGGVTDGPIVSQFLLQTYFYNGTFVNGRVLHQIPNQDYITYFPEWVDAQNGFAVFPAAPPSDLDPTPRYLHDARGMGRNADGDFIHTAYTAVILQAGALGMRSDPANPYVGSHRQGGFSTFGLAHVLSLVVGVIHSERQAWFHKWNVHRYLRPEEGAGLVHKVKAGLRDYPLHPDLIAHSSVLPLLFESNRQMNVKRLGIDAGSYMLPMIFRVGGPTFPSFPSGHATTAAACATVLKAWFDEDQPFPHPMVPTADGLGLVPYTPPPGSPPLTIGGELNKLAHNYSLGRDMGGIHWRGDTEGGHVLGEELAIRFLREERPTYPEPFHGFTLTRFNGEKITI